MSDELNLTLAAIVGAIAVLVFVPLTIRLWRNELPGIDQQSPLLVRSSPARERGHTRALPTWMASLTLVAFGAICQRLIPGDVGVWAAVGCLVISGLLLVPIALIVLINRPKALVPPHLRDQPGYISDRRRQPDGP